VFLRREGLDLNYKRLFRRYREQQLHVRRRGGRKRAMGTRAPMVLPFMPNQLLSLDFVSDQLEDGRRFTLTPGTSYQVADHAEPHRSSTTTGAKLFIVD
jgi:putative transposase